MVFSSTSTVTKTIRNLVVSCKIFRKIKRGDDWDDQNDELQIVTEKQRHEIDSERRKEKHRIRVISEGGKDSIRYALRWGNDQGMTKDTPFATFNQHR